MSLSISRRTHRARHPEEETTMTDKKHEPKHEPTKKKAEPAKKEHGEHEKKHEPAKK